VAAWKKKKKKRNAIKMPERRGPHVTTQEKGVDFSKAGGKKRATSSKDKKEKGRSQ